MERRDYRLIGETVYSGILPNGLTVFVIPKHGFSKYFAYFAANYGSIDRRFKHAGNWFDTPNGVAHFLEHKMFETADGDAMTKLSSNGAMPNAYTTSDLTAYHFDCTDRFFENLETMLDFVSTPYFTPEGVGKERGIIEQEILMCEDDPDHCLYYGLMESLFKHHPLRDAVTGTVESVSRITAETLSDCHNAFYNPSNMVLCVAGDVDPVKVAALAQNVLPDSRGSPPERDYGPKEDLRPVSNRFSREMDVSLPVFLAGCKLPSVANESENLRFELTSTLALELLSGHSSPLYFRLYDEGLISSDFSASVDLVPGAAYLMFGGETREPARVFDAVLEEVFRVVESGPDPWLFNRIKKAAVGSYIRMLDSFDAICSSIAGGFFQGYEAFEAIDLLNEITEADVSAFLRDCISAENMAESLILPKS